jgi:hypothetical protein
LGVPTNYPEYPNARYISYLHYVLWTLTEMVEQPIILSLISNKSWDTERFLRLRTHSRQRFNTYLISYCIKLYTAKNEQVVAILMKTGLNNVLLPTLFTVVNNIDNNIEQYCWQVWTTWAAKHCSILLNSVVSKSL